MNEPIPKPQERTGKLPPPLPQPPVRRPLFSWRRLRTVALVIFSVVVVALLINAEESWRARRDWKRCRQELEKRGERLDLVAFTPKPVSAELNFAATPLLLKVLDKKGAKNFLSIYLNTAKNIPIVAGWREGRSLDLTAWKEFLRQGNKYPSAGEAKSESEDILAALSKYDAELAELRQAAQRPQAQFTLTWSSNVTELLASHLVVVSAVKSAAQMLALHASASLAANRSEDALADVQVNGRFVEALRSQPMMDVFMARVALNDLVLQPVWEGLSTHRWNVAQLEALEKELTRLDFLVDGVQTLRAERAFMNEMFEQMRSQDVRVNVDQPFDASQPNPEERTLFSRLTGPGWVLWRNQVVGNECRQDVIDALQKAVQQPGSSAVLDAALTNRWLQRVAGNSSSTVMAKPLVAQTFLMAMQACRAQTTVNLARVACALERYRVAHGRYPGKLDELVPTTLNRLPLDLFLGQPFHYRLGDDGGFLLYSVGVNMKDDGGRVKTGYHRGMAYDQGDLVWHCPEKR